ncbi:MAG TPA: hypothetical protein VFP84_15565 [Kofleriaceae bacterium]|nr:hypothetical protein [Kofleriaceae bacterium]
MSARRRSTHIPAVAVVLASAFGWGGVAAADISAGVITAFKGDLVVTKGELPEGKNEKETITKIRGDKLKEVVGEAHDDVTYWHFHYTAFLSKAGSSVLKMEFYTADKKLAADSRLDGVDPKATVQSGDISINEDEGLNKGKTYTVKLVNDKDAVVASTTLTMK